MPKPERSFRPHPDRASPDLSTTDDPRERTPPLNDAPRDAAFRALAKQCRRFPDLDLRALESILDELSLDSRDRAFVHAIYDSVIRRWITLEYLIQQRLRQEASGLEPKVRAVLLGGAAQILLLDKIPQHAAINHAVEWAKRSVRPGAGGLVNAVLRKIAALRNPDEPHRPKFTGLRDELPMGDGTAIPLTASALPEDPIARLFLSTGIPGTLGERWMRERPEREVRELALHSLLTPPTIINAAHAGAPPPALACLTPHTVPGHWVFSGTRIELVDLLGTRQDLWVQDPASSAGVAGIAELRPHIIADLCAGQGTKTRQLAAVFPDALIFATDIDGARTETLREVFVGHPRVTVIGFGEVRDRLHAHADLILLDVPCSNTGVLARRPEARYRVDPEHLASLTNIQRQTIANAIPLLRERPAGKILYSTCSLEQCENDDQAAWAHKWHGFASVRPRTRLPMGSPGDPPQSLADGSYSVLLDRS